MSPCNNIHMSHTSPEQARLANQRWWNFDAEQYHQAHPEYLSSFYWCPEMLSEQQAQLLGDCSNQRVLELGCGSGPCASWLASTYPSATVIGIDIAKGMLSRGEGFHGLLADVHRIPLADQSMDCAFSAFGAFPFIPQLTPALREVARVLKPGTRLVISVNHPMRWVFPDHPGTQGLIATHSYFEHSYVEHDADGELSYAEFQHTMSDWIQAFDHSGFRLHRLIEPEWPEDLHITWGQWSPLRGKLFPGTVIFCATKD